jgi:hypothetical protein
VGLVGLATNAHALVEPHVPWLTTHGAVLAAVGLLLGRGLRTLLIPSTNRHSRLFVPCGSNPLTDPALSTEALELVHYGCHRSRIQKIRALANRPEVRAHLRVCWQGQAAGGNCGRCVKCLKVMLPLALEGVLDRFPGFPPLPPWDALDPACFAPVDLARYAPEQSYAAELLALAREKGQAEAARAIERHLPAGSGPAA